MGVSEHEDDVMAVSKAVEPHNLIPLTELEDFNGFSLAPRRPLRQRGTSSRTGVLQGIAQAVEPK